MATIVLVADDNLTIQRTAAEVLSSEGLEVVTVANGMAAIKKISALRPLVVVADVDMPGRDGYEVCEFVKAQPGLVHIRVLLAVSDTDPYDQERGMRVRADGVIKKPFVREELTSLVAKSIEQAHLLFPAALAPPAGESYRAPEEELSGQGTLQAPGEENESIIEGGPVVALPVTGILEPPAIASNADSSNEHESTRATDESRAVCSPAEAPAKGAMPFRDANLAPEVASSNREDAWSDPPRPASPEAPDSDLNQENPSGPNSFAGPSTRLPQGMIGAPAVLPSLPIPDFFTPSDMLEPEYGAFPLSELAPNLLLNQEEVQGAPDCEEDCESPAMIEDADVAEVAINSSAATLEIPPPALPETPYAGQETASERSLDALPPGSQIDPALVSSVINAVVKRIAPPALSPEMIHSLECKLTDEILSELASGS